MDLSAVLACCLVWGATFEVLISGFIHYCLWLGCVGGRSYVCSFGMKTCIGIFSLQDLCMIGRHEGEENICYLPSKRGSFEVKSYYLL
jgi:hypothetical protein